MVKGLILDVDGVLVGKRQGYNWPDPHPDVIRALKDLCGHGMPVSLCTGKGTFAIRKIVEAAHLTGVHIGDGGAVVTDVLNNKIIDVHPIGKTDVRRFVTLFSDHHIYLELYTTDGYHVAADAVGDKTVKHTSILQTEPTVAPSLLEVTKHQDIVKIMPVADDEAQKRDIVSLFAEVKSDLVLQWGVHPTAMPYHFGIITAAGISKQQAAGVISEYEHVPLVSMLGIGDSLTDWQFMDICGYAGAMGNGSDELKRLVATKGESGYIGASVDENGVLDILKHFRVLHGGFD